MHTTDETAVAEIAVEIAEAILDHELTACWSYDADTDRLTPLAATEAVWAMLDDADLDGLPALGPDSFEMEVFEAGEPVLVEDYQTAVEVHADTPLGTVLMLPINGYGVLHVGATERREVTAEEQSLLEIFARHLAEAFERTVRERDLEAQNERLETFAATVAHDLRNPLGVAQGRLELAMEGEDSHLQAVAEAHDRMEALIEDLLTLARQGRAVVDPEPVALGTVIEDALATLPSDRLTVALDGSDVQFIADRSRLCELLENLLANAAEHAGGSAPAADAAMPAGENDSAEVAVRIGWLADASGFYVADDGPGIPPAEREQVFDAGYSTMSADTGLGLSIVEQICEGHNWDIRITESELGGARFEVTNVEPV